MPANKENYASESAAARFMSTVPDDLLLEILIQLPRMGPAITVCKSWHSLIISDHPNAFLRHTLHHHHRRQSRDPDPSYTPPCTLLIGNHPADPCVQVLCEKSKILEAALSRQSPQRSLLGFVSNLNSKAIKASFNNSLLIDLNDQYCIYNPVTREQRLLPYPPSANGSSFVKLMLVGREEPNKVFRFRVVQFQFRPQPTTSSVMVFSSETRQWNESLLKFYPPTMYYPIVATEGAILWQQQYSGFCLYEPFRQGNDPSSCRIIKFPSALTPVTYFFLQMGAVIFLQIGAVRGRFRVSEMVLDKKDRSYRLRIWELSNGSDDQYWRFVREVLFKREVEGERMCVVAFHPEDGDVIFVSRGFVIYRCELNDHKFRKVGEVSGVHPLKLSVLHLILRVFSFIPYPVVCRRRTGSQSQMPWLCVEKSHFEFH